MWILLIVLCIVLLVLGRKSILKKTTGKGAKGQIINDQASVSVDRPITEKEKITAQISDMPFDAHQRLPKSYVVLDFETTGLSPEIDRIIEIGAIKVIDCEEVGSVDSLVNPERSIPKEITTLTGISSKDVAEAPKESEIVHDLHSFIGDCPIVAHNANFDIGFLREAYKRANISANIEYIDTLSLSRKAFPTAPNHKLSTLIEYLNLGSSQNHRALSDVHLTNALFIRCLEQVKQVQLEKKTEKISPPPTLSDEQRTIAEWAKNVLVTANRDTSMLAFEPMSKYFRISYYYQVLDIKLGGKLQYAVIESRYLNLIDERKLVPCAKSEGPSCDGLHSMRFPIKSSANLDELAPVLLAAFDRALLQYQSARKYLSERSLKAHFARAIQI